MSLFVDTSGFHALLVGSEPDSEAVLSAFRRAAESGRRMLTSNYVVLETTALLQNRVGLSPVRDLEARFLPLMEIVFVDAAFHRRAVERLLRIDRRRISLVDASSFEVMDAQGISDVLGLDADFEEQGFRLVP